jgi:hypothetical protein
VTGAQGVGDLAIALEQPNRDPAGVGESRFGRLQLAGDRIDGACGFGRFPSGAARPADVRTRGHFMQPGEQVWNARIAPGRGEYDRHAEFARERTRIHCDAVALRLVDEVHAHHGAVGDVEHLQHEIQIALESRGVGHDHRDVGTSEQDEIAGDILVDAGRQQRVGAGQIDDAVLSPTEREAALGARDRLAGPVARVLAQSRQRIEHRALSDVGIAGQRDHAFGGTGGFPPAYERLRGVQHTIIAGGGCGCGRILPSIHTHQFTAFPSSSGSTRIMSAWRRRSAMSASRTR